MLCVRTTVHQSEYGDRGSAGSTKRSVASPPRMYPRPPRFSHRARFPPRARHLARSGRVPRQIEKIINKRRRASQNRATPRPKRPHRRCPNTRRAAPCASSGDTSGAQDAHSPACYNLVSPPASGGGSVTAPSWCSACGIASPTIEKVSSSCHSGRSRTQPSAWLFEYDPDSAASWHTWALVSE